MIIVTGANGQLGRAIVRRLLERMSAAHIGVSVRDPAGAREPEERGVRVRQGDFTDAASLAHAFEGPSQVLISPANLTGEARLRMHRTAIEQAKAAGAGRILYASHMAASPVSLFPPMPDHAATEDMLRDSGVTFTSLRCGFYAASGAQIIKSAVETGELVGPEDGTVLMDSPRGSGGGRCDRARREAPRRRHSGTDGRGGDRPGRRCGDGVRDHGPPDPPCRRLRGGGESLRCRAGPPGGGSAHAPRSVRRGQGRRVRPGRPDVGPADRPSSDVHARGSRGDVVARGGAIAAKNDASAADPRDAAVLTRLTRRPVPCRRPPMRVRRDGCSACSTDRRSALIVGLPAHARSL